MLFDKLKQFQDSALLLARIGAGTAFTFIHGLPKIQGGPATWEKIGGAMTNVGITFLPTFWGFMAAASEFFGGILLILGLFFRPTTAFLIFTMFMAMMQHLSRLDSWARVIYPLEMLSLFIVLLAVGPGKYSLDYLLFDRKIKDLQYSERSSSRFKDSGSEVNPPDIKQR
jgi:putative oxidoreductase